MCLVNNGLQTENVNKHLQNTQVEWRTGANAHFHCPAFVNSRNEKGDHQFEQWFRLLAI